MYADVRDIPADFEGMQDPDERLWDLLYMAAHVARRRKNRNAEAFVFSLIMPVKAGTNNYRARCHVGSGDAWGEPVITILRSDEDRRSTS